MSYKYNDILQSNTLRKQSMSALSENNKGSRIFLTEDEFESKEYEPGLYFVDTTTSPYSFHKIDFNNTYDLDPTTGDQLSYEAQTRFYEALEDLGYDFNGFCATSYSDFERIFNSKHTTFINGSTNRLWFCTKDFSSDTDNFYANNFYTCEWRDTHWAPVGPAQTPVVLDSILFSKISSSHFTNDLNTLIADIETESNKFAYLNDTCKIKTLFYEKGWYEVAEDEEHTGNYYWKKVEEGSSYTAGNGIDITDDVISNTGLINTANAPQTKQNLSILGGYNDWSGCINIGYNTNFAYAYSGLYGSSKKCIVIGNDASVFIAQDYIFPDASYHIVVGADARAGGTQYDPGVTRNSILGTGNIAIGGVSRAYSLTKNCGSIAIGYSAESKNNNAIAIGYQAQSTAAYSIQIGEGTNNNANTFKVANTNGNFEIMSADGTIPEARLADTTSATEGQILTLDSNLNAVWADGGSGGVSDVTLDGTSIVEDGVAEIKTSDIVKTPTTMPILATTDWVLDSGTNKYIQTVNITGVTSSNVVYVSPAPTVIDEYSACGVYAFAQGEGTLSFRCTTVPENDLSVIVIIM